MKQTWTVVKFYGENGESDSVAAIPTFWIEGEYTLWPNLSADKITATIKSHKIDKSWPRYKVSVF